MLAECKTGFHARQAGGQAGRRAGGNRAFWGTGFPYRPAGQSANAFSILKGPCSAAFMETFLRNVNDEM